VSIPLRPLALAVLGALAFVPAACGDDGGGGGGEAVETSTSTSPSAATEVSLVAQLSGKEEVPGPGVTDGTGLAEVRITGTAVCYKLNATMGEMPTAAHIHTGASGTAGGVAVNLMPNFTKGESAFISERCIEGDAAALAPIGANPAGFYVNIHTAEHPDGAMRGQLAKAPGNPGY
jgi:hypothetical protein